MSVYALVSSILSYVFTTIIYLFIFSVIALIYMDIKRANRGEVDITDEDTEENSEKEKRSRGTNKREHSALLRTVKTAETKKSGMESAYRIYENGAIVGRGKECDICIKDMYLSVEHFQVWYDDGEWYIADMGSKNGTFLNELRLKKVKTLHSGDEISFGGLQVIFEEET